MSTELIESDNIAQFIIDNTDLPMEPAKISLVEQKIFEMIDAGYDINLKTDRNSDTGIRPLQAAIKFISGVSITLIQKLIDKGADVNAYFCEDDYYDHFAEGDYENDYWGFSEYFTDLCMYAPLHIAAAENRPDIMQTLIKAGADVNLKAGNDEKVPLDFAKTEETRKVLLDAGADESLAED